MNNNYVTYFSPVISFDTIVDEDVAIIQYIYNNYLDDTIFNKSKFDVPLIDIIKSLYIREESNPLLLYTLPSINREEIDELYKDLLDKKYKEILQCAIGTSMQTLISSYNKSGEIKTSILCYNDIQAEYIRSLSEFAKNKIVMADSINDTNYIKNNQYYFKYIEQSFPIYKYFTRTSIYYSDRLSNLNMLTDTDNMNDDLRQFLLNNNIKVFSMYEP